VKNWFEQILFHAGTQLANPATVTEERVVMYEILECSSIGRNTRG